MENLYKQFPNEFLDQCRAKLGARSDSQMSKLTRIDTSVITKLRHGRFGVSAGVLLAMHAATGWSVEELRSLLYQRELTGTMFLSPKVRVLLQVKIKPEAQRADHRVRDDGRKRVNNG